MYALSNGTSVKTVGKNNLFHFIITLRRGNLEDWTVDTFDELIEDVQRKCGSDDPLIVFSFEEGLIKEEFLKLSALINKSLAKRKWKDHLIVSPVSTTTRVAGKKAQDSAQGLIQSLFQNERSMGKMIGQFTCAEGQDIPVDKDQLITLLLELVESQGLGLDEQEIMNMVTESKSLKEIANAIMRISHIE